MPLAETPVLVQKFDQAIATLEAAHIARVDKALESSYATLERKLRTSYTKFAGNTSLLATQRSLLVLQEVKDLASLVNPTNAARYEARFAELLTATSAEGGTLAGELIKAAAPDGFDLKPFAGVNIAAVAASARDSTTRLQSWSDQYRERIGAVVQQGLVQGWGATKVATVLQGQLGILKGRAEAIARTESISAFDTSSRDRYARNGIQYVQLFAVGDRRVCGYCSWRTGKVFRLDEARVPSHVRCRCYSVPWSQEWEGDAEFVRGYAGKVQAAGLEPPKSGAAPFEQAAGLSAPTVVWEL